MSQIFKYMSASKPNLVWWSYRGNSSRGLVFLQMLDEVVIHENAFYRKTGFFCNSQGRCI